jgi:group II intron reverse transcriptase/maturase
MNEPLRHKLFSVYGTLLNERALREAWEKVRRNKGAGGVDRVTIDAFEEDLEANLQSLLGDLRGRTYKPSPVRRVRIPKKNGKTRPLGIPTIRDRIVQQALVTSMSPFFEDNVFHPDSCGFRPGMGVQDALERVIWNLELGYRYVYDLDIKGYFDNIPHKRLMGVLSKYVSDGTVLDLIWRSLKAGYMEDGVTYETPSGTMQGGVISPLIANIYLNELDWELDRAGIAFVRYAD